MAKVTKSKRMDKEAKRETVVVKTMANSGKVGPRSPSMWWLLLDEAEMCAKLVETASWLKDSQQSRIRQASVHARLYGNIPLVNFVGTTGGALNTNAPQLPVDRPTMNVVQSCVDTLCSRITQSKPTPMFLTDNGDYKKRNLAKQLNNFRSGEFYRTRAYEMGEKVFREGSVLGTGALKVIRTQDNRVGLETRLITELYVDNNDAFYGTPRTLYEIKLVDREVAMANYPELQDMIKDQAEQAYPDNSGDSNKTVSDMIMFVESWRLPSHPKANDGMHIIAVNGCTKPLVKEEYKKKRFPFAFFHYSPRLVGFWSQGLPEQLIGTQVEINKLLVTISQSISLVGVPRVFVEDGSKVVKAHLNNQVGSIVTYRGTKPEYEVAPCVPQELYAQLQRLVEYAYQQSGVSALTAVGQKPAGLDSGDALDAYDQIQSDRFATVDKRYKMFYEDLEYLMIDLAKDICEETGEYSTVYPDKDGTRQIDLPKVNMDKDEFQIQCFDTSSLPKEPAGRLRHITEMMQAGVISLQEGRRLLDYPDLEQVEKLESAAEERILKQLDAIVEDGDYTPPDPFTDIQLGVKLVSQYYNLYMAYNLEENKAQMLRDYQAQLLMLQQASMPPAPPAMAPPGAPGPQAVPEAPPTSSILPNAG